MSSIPTNFQFIVLVIASITLYVIHWVSLWNGTRSSPSSVEADSALRAEHGHTSPKETPASVTRDAGQTGLNPSIRTCHRAARGTALTEPWSLDSDSKKSMDSM